MNAISDPSCSIPTVELFIQTDCPACDHVQTLLESFSDAGRLHLRIYTRRSHPSLFSHRHISIVPATFIDERLTFYGEFSEAKLRRHLTRS